MPKKFMAANGSEVDEHDAKYTVLKGEEEFYLQCKRTGQIPENCTYQLTDYRFQTYKRTSRDGRVSFEILEAPLMIDGPTGRCKIAKTPANLRRLETVTKKRVETHYKTELKPEGGMIQTPYEVTMPGLYEITGIEVTDAKELLKQEILAELGEKYEIREKKQEPVVTKPTPVKTQAPLKIEKEPFIKPKPIETKKVNVKIKKKRKPLSPEVKARLAENLAKGRATAKANREKKKEELSPSPS